MYSQLCQAGKHDVLIVVVVNDVKNVNIAIIVISVITVIFVVIVKIVKIAHIATNVKICRIKNMFVRENSTLINKCI